VTNPFQNFGPVQRKRSKKHQPHGCDILYEDRDIIVINKAAGLLSISTGRSPDRTAYSALMDYVRKGNHKSRARVFIVHRLDKDTSGVLVLARSEEAKRKLQEGWKDTEKTYLAMVHGHPDPPEGTISSYLIENNALNVFSTQDPALGKFSETKYKVVKRVADRALVEIELLTGRKNQIRVHLADKGWPIVGDSKYGRKDREAKRLALHAYKLSVNHPYSGEKIHFTAPIPGAFYRVAASPAPDSPRKKS